ncbi:MAG: glycosyl transferase family 2 [Desulfovibrionaceae bacterium]
MNAQTLHRYTAEVLSFAFSGACPTSPPAAAPAAAREHADRILRLFSKSPTSTLVLLGLGEGSVASLLAESMREGERLIVCEADPALARALAEAGRLGWWTPESPHSLIADTSPWALVYLLCQSGVTPLGATLANNPLSPPPAPSAQGRDPLKQVQQALRQGRLKAAINGTPLGHFAVQTPSLSAGCILSPEEPGLERFLAQVPDWVEELVLLWDAEEVPKRPVQAACPVRQLAHPLDGDFAAQRNRLLAACGADWVLMLDADEDFDPDIWTMLPGLLPLRDVDGFWFQRQTFYPDEDHYRVGYGLWPDLQLRLFRNLPGLRFTGSVHERLEGLPGRVGLVLDAPIRHHTFTTKDREAIRAKLRGFDAASGGRVAHTLSEEYPHLPNDCLHRAHLLWNEFQVLLLPGNPV